MDSTFYFLEPANFLDYRSFLRKRLEDMKVKNGVYSLQYCAQKSNISKSHLQLILQKKRHISLDKFPLLAKTLKLTDEEEYFTYLMICKNSSKNPRITNHFDKILSRVKNQYIKSDIDAPLEVIDENIQNLFEDFLLIVIQTQAKLVNFKEDPKWICENLKVPGLSEAKVSSALKTLEDEGFIKRNNEGKLTTEKHFFYRPDPYNPNGQSIYTRAARFLVELMQNHSEYKPSIYSSMSLGMDEEHLQKAEKLMTEVHHTLCSYAKESTNAVANVYVSNYFLTLSSLEKS